MNSSATGRFRGPCCWGCWVASSCWPCTGASANPAATAGQAQPPRSSPAMNCPPRHESHSATARLPRGVSRPRLRAGPAARGFVAADAAGKNLCRSGGGRGAALSVRAGPLLVEPAVCHLRPGSAGGVGAAGPAAPGLRRRAARSGRAAPACLLSARGRVVPRIPRPGAQLLGRRLGLGLGRPLQPGVVLSPPPAGALAPLWRRSPAHPPAAGQRGHRRLSRPDQRRFRRSSRSSARSPVRSPSCPSGCSRGASAGMRRGRRRC